MSVILQNCTKLFDELKYAEISFQGKRLIKEYSLLDLEGDNQGFLFNKSNSVAEYRNHMHKLHLQFKRELNKLSSEPTDVQLFVLYGLKRHLRELTTLLHPKVEETIFSLVSVQKYSNRMQTTMELSEVKKKLRSF